MNALEMVRLPALMERTLGNPRVRIGLIDGPVLSHHPELATDHIHLLRKDRSCASGNRLACQHGTFVAGVLSARRGTTAPAICPDCTLLVYPIFSETRSDMYTPSTTSNELATAILACIDAGANVLNQILHLAVELRAPGVF
jgi:hypothetical protein